MRKNVKNSIFFLIAIFLLNAGFFSFYSQKIGLQLSVMSVIFILLFTVNYFLLLHILKNSILRALFIFSAFIFLWFYTLINFAYYKIFNSFWRINLAQLREINKPLIALLSGYSYIIPLQLWIAVSLFTALSIILTFFYLCQNKTTSHSVILKERQRLKDPAVKNKTIGILRPPGDRAQNDALFHSLNAGKDTGIFLNTAPACQKKISIFIFIIFFIALNLIFYRAQSYEDFSALSRSEYYSNLGIYGYLFNEIGEYGKRSVKNFIAKGVDEPSIQSDMEIVKENLMELAQLNSAEAKQITFESLNTPHIIIYQMESVDSWALAQNPSPMPFLQKLLDENISTDHFFSNSCTTINAEFSSVCSFYPESSGPISDLFSGNNYYCLPSILKERYDYKTSLYHANSGTFWNRETLAPKWGYDNMYFSPYFKVRETDGNVLADMVARMKNAGKPTFNYVVGFTSHGPHNQQFIDFNQNENNIEITPYPYELNKETMPAQDEETIRNYLGFLTEIDNGIKNLFSELEKNDLMKNTIVILYGDHRYYSFNTSDTTSDFYNYNEVPFVMHVPNHSKEKVKYIASQVDIAPTILNIVEGGNFSPPENFIGKSIFSKDHPESAISKCLGETLYVDKNIILKNDMLIGIDQPIAYLDDYAEEKLKNYEGCLSKVIEESDKIMTENILCGGEEENVGQILNFDQETDSDKDGLSDLREKTLGTDRLNPDTDGDGFLDGVEVINGYNPFGKGIGILKRIPRGKDTDHDGLPDEEELKFGTDINNPDTDGDGYLDGGEIIRGYNPMGEGGL